MAVLDLVEDLEMEERNAPVSQAKTGDTVLVTTLEGVGKIPAIAEAAHANGAVVVATISVSNPWILTNLERYCDALVASFSASNAVLADVLCGRFYPVGKLPVTMVSSNEVVAVSEVTLADGTVAEICVSPNDVPGYDKDQYIDPEILAKVPGGSYAYCDAEGNYYVSGFGLTY